MNELCQRLHDAFAPIVNAVMYDLIEMEGYEVTTKVEFDKAQELYEFHVVLHDASGFVTAHELQQFADVLGEFGNWETTRHRRCIGSCNDKLKIEGDDGEWAIGDGDDTLAVTYAGGAFRIWVRPLDDDGVLMVDRRAA